MKKKNFYPILALLFCTFIQGAKNKSDGILEKILCGDLDVKKFENFDYNKAMRPVPTKTEVPEDCHNPVLDKISDKDIIAVATFYCEMYKLLVNVVARGMHDAYVMNDESGTANLTSHFTQNILSAYEKITEIYVKMPVHVRRMLHAIDYTIKMSKTVDGYNGGYSLIDIYQLVSLLVDKNRYARKDYENRAFCERALFEKINIPTDDCCFKKFGMKSFAPLWDKAVELRSQIGFAFDLSTFFPFLMGAIASKYPKIAQENYLLCFNMIFADPSIRLVKRIAEIKFGLENVKDVEEKKRINTFIDEVIEKLPVLQNGYRAQSYEDKMHQVYTLPLVNLYNFLNTGHITLSHLSVILTKLKPRVKKLSQDAELLEIERCIKHISMFFNLVRRLPKESKKLVSEAKKSEMPSDQAIDSVYGLFIYDPILTPPSFKKSEARTAMMRLVDAFEVRLQNNAEFNVDEKSVKNFQIKIKKRKGIKESTVRLAVELMGYILGDYDWRVGSGGDIFVRRRLFDGNDILTILYSSSVSPILEGEEKKIYQNIVHDIAAPENEKNEKIDLINDVLSLADKNEHKIFVLSDGATISPALVNALGYQPGELNGYHVLLCPVVIVKPDCVESVSAVFKKMKDLAMESVMGVLARLVPPSGLFMGLLYVLVPHAKASGTKIESEACKFTVFDAGFCRYSQQGLTKYKSIKDAIDDDSKDCVQVGEPLLEEKYFKNICLLSSSEKGELAGYIRDSWKLKILFALHESFYSNAVFQKRESELVPPYFNDLFELCQSLTKKCSVMSQKASELVKNFEEDEKKQTAYTTKNIMSLVLAYSADQELLTKIVGLEKGLEEFLFPDGQLRILEDDEKEMNLRIHMFKRSFGIKDGIELFEKGPYLLSESSKFPPMKKLYEEILDALLKHRFIRDYPKLLFGLLGKDKENFFREMTGPWIWQNRLFDMSRGKLAFIPREKYKDRRTKVYELRGLLKDLSENSKKKKLLNCNGFLTHFYNDLDAEGQLYRTMLSMTGGLGDCGYLMHYCNFYGTCSLVSATGDKEAQKLQDNAAEIFCKFVGQSKKKDGKKLMGPFLEGFAKQNSGYQMIEKK